MHVDYDNDGFKVRAASASVPPSGDFSFISESHRNHESDPSQSAGVRGERRSASRLKSLPASGNFLSLFQRGSAGASPYRSDSQLVTPSFPEPIRALCRAAGLERAIPVESASAGLASAGSASLQACRQTVPVPRRALRVRRMICCPVWKERAGRVSSAARAWSDFGSFLPGDVAGGLAGFFGSVPFFGGISTVTGGVTASIRLGRGFPRALEAWPASA